MVRNYVRVETRINAAPSLPVPTERPSMTGKQLREARHKLGLSMRALGVRLGHPPSGYTWRTVAAWERGEFGIPPAVEKLVIMMLRKTKKA